jgi:hypothetical protein
MESSLNVSMRALVSSSYGFILAVALMLLVAALVYATRDNDPMHEGKCLSKHLEAFTDGGLSAGRVNLDRPEVLRVPGIELRCSDLRAYDAIRSVGTNALPMLVRMLRSYDSRPERWIYHFVQGHPFLRKHQFVPSADWVEEHPWTLTDFGQDWWRQAGAQRRCWEDYEKVRALGGLDVLLCGTVHGER